MSRRKSPGTAIAVRTPPRRESDDSPDPTAEKLPVPQDVIVPAALLLAADFASDHKDAVGVWAQGVFLHAHEGMGRAVGSDGARMFVSSFRLPEPAAWLADGVILSNEGLKARVGMIAKADSSGFVRIRFAKGLARAEMSDPDRSMLFQVPVIDSPFPDYERWIGPASFAALDEDGEVARGKEWEPIGINSQYLKHVGEIARVLEAGLPKEARSKKSMVVRAFAGDGKPSTPLIFDFSTWPGAILGLSAAKLSSAETAPETAALLAPAIRMTIAALRAHATRNLAWAEDAPSELAKAAFLAKAEGFQARVAEILKRAPGLPALAA